MMLKAHLITGLVFGVVIVFSGPQNMKGAEMLNQQTDLTEQERATITEMATKKARELGYKPEELNFKLSKEDDLFKARFYPKQIKGVVIYGGMVDIYLDRKGNIVRVERGL